METREKIILAKIKQIKTNKKHFWKIAKEQTVKRVAWYIANKEKLTLTGSLVRQAYTLVMVANMKINLSEIPVIYEDKKKIIWHSFNFCPVLEACKCLGLDTRVICRIGYEKPIQNLISCLNPKLRFSRNYEKIRPYVEYCEEIIEFIE